MNISVIIPNYNRQPLLARCLGSVFNQTHTVDEVIVVDDGSTDASVQEIQQNWPQVTLIAQDNHGVSHARNIGIAAASSDWIAFLDSDDEWLPEKIAAQVSLIENEPDAKLIHTDEIWIRNGVRVNAMDKHQKRGGDIFQYCLPLCCISPSSVLIKRALFDEVGNFNESLPACEDYDLWLRICAHYEVHYLEEKLLIKYGGHEDQLSRKYWGMDRFRIQSLDKLLQSGVLDPRQTQLAMEMLFNKIEIMQKGAVKHNNTELLVMLENILNRYESHHQEAVREQS